MRAFILMVLAALAFVALAVAVFAAVYYGIYCDWPGQKEVAGTLLGLLFLWGCGSSGSGGSRNWEGNVDQGGG